jgi:hypothetical protein
MFGLLSALWPFASKNDQGGLDLARQHQEAVVQSVVNHVFQDDDDQVDDQGPQQDQQQVDDQEVDDKKPFIKPMYFHLETQTPADDLRAPRGIIRVGRIAVPVEPVDFYHTILGAHNYFLNRTCETWGLLAIYPEGNEIVFHGTRSKVIKAMNVMRWRIHVCGRRLNIDTSAF